MTKTWYDASLWTPDESWRTIRNLRASPTTPISNVLTKPRSDVFHMALEQAEQLYRAARPAGKESRPLLLFYGLSQAGRALAAASSSLGAGEWESSGHGLKSATKPVTTKNFWNTEIGVRPTNKDSFSRASIALQSATDIRSTTLGAAVANIIEFIYEYHSWSAYPRAVAVESAYLKNDMPSLDLDHVDIPVGLHEEDLAHAADPEFMTTIPAFAAYKTVRDEFGDPKFDRSGHLLVRVPTEDLTMTQGRSALPKTTQSYRGSHFVLRGLGNAGSPVHPLMAWWLTLHTLSMLARYEPRQWQSVLDLRSSEVSSQIEFLVDRALDAVPQLLAESLLVLNSPGSQP